jgi:dihydrofolate synthase/folylpolyglutamate synthase
MQALAASLGDVFPGTRPVAVVSVLEDKDVAAMLAPLIPLCNTVVVTRSSHRRAADPERVARLARDRGADCTVVGDPRLALREAVRRAGPRGGVLVCGSLYLLSDLRADLLTARPAT